MNRHPIARSWRLATAAAALAGLAACGLGEAAAPRPAAPTASAPAQDLRVALTNLLGEHVTLAAAATGAAVDGRESEFEAAAGALDLNSRDLAAAIGSVYGPQAGNSFLPLWRSHIGMFVDYATAAAAGNDRARQAAADALTQYANNFAAFLNSANPNLPQETVAGLFRDHVTTLAPVIDAQSRGDHGSAFRAERVAIAHMSMIAGALADAIYRQFPDRFAAGA